MQSPTLQKSGQVLQLLCILIHILCSELLISQDDFKRIERNKIYQFNVTMNYESFLFVVGKKIEKRLMNIKENIKKNGIKKINTFNCG